ncbi:MULTISPECIES: sensor domain-containing protein [unclassified Streptomyces]|uniref:sensor histidine kinase n=1 Tax=unclassified Streptomyces TaxID=2593676 RepID=UPI002DDBC542|nr:sensor domain-containing protein [Streptomyces sp. NBC_01775]WSB79602.1 sensor domain-containing protein [Streptomyces sp. NBC_01775]WSS40907.1 sensor domain-containing protein [Streptomyces sp. NBC_01187]
MTRSEGTVRAAPPVPAAVRSAWQTAGPRGGRPWSAGLAASRGVALAFLSLGGSLALFITTVLSLALLLLGVGFFTTPWVLQAVRMHANRRRQLAGDWAGVKLLAPYRLLPQSRIGVTGHVERCVLMLKDPATWRDLVWLIVDATVGFAIALLPPALILYGIEGWVMLCGLWHAVAGDYWYGFVHVENFGDAVQCALLGTFLLLTALSVNQHLVKAHFQVARAFLSPTREALLAQRVERLYETRHDAVDTSAAELRRIERDLHDGAQARMVAMGMSLGAIETLIEHDPAKAKQLIGQARESSAEALTELRDLVRGIHPPVLAERGLGDAAEALTLRMQVPVEVDIDLPGRFDEPVETAAYFAISEVLTNAVKHAEAGRIWLDVHHTYDAGGMLRIAVTDDGKGGADVTKGSGIAGVQRRLGQFDGILAVTSPSGGPTMVTMEIPSVPVL